MRIFRKSVEEVQIPLKYDKNRRVLYIMTSVHLWLYLSQFLLELEIFQTKIVEKSNTHISCSVTFFRQSCRIWNNVENCGTARQSTDYNIIMRMRFALWIIMANYTHSEYAILNCFSTHPLRKSFLPLKHIKYVVDYIMKMERDTKFRLTRHK